MFSSPVAEPRFRTAADTNGGIRVRAVLTTTRSIWRCSILHLCAIGQHALAFCRYLYDPFSSISRIGGGSLGGKARGLSFVNILLNNYNVQDHFENIRIYIPPAVVIGTDIFDQFLEENKLKEFALGATDDEKIIEEIVARDIRHFRTGSISR